jgi:hypothetical protein
VLYLNRGSSHTSPCYRAIESGVLGRLAKLTTATAAILGRPMHQLYPEHAKALQRAGLSSSCLPTLRQVLDCRSGSQGRSRSRSATKSRAVFFCLGFSKFWKTPIHVLLRRLLTLTLTLNEATILRHVASRRNILHTGQQHITEYFTSLT